MQTRGQRALHPRQVARFDPDETARVVALDRDEVEDAGASRHRRPTVRMSADEIERAVAESAPQAPARTRLARGSGPLDVTPPVAYAVDDFDPPALLPFRARRPVLATALTAALATAALLLLHHIIAAS
jgi:hypothetical protein